MSQSISFNYLIHIAIFSGSIVRICVLYLLSVDFVFCTGNSEYVLFWSFAEDVWRTETKWFFWLGRSGWISPMLLPHVPLPLLPCSFWRITGGPGCTSFRPVDLWVYATLHRMWLWSPSPWACLPWTLRDYGIVCVIFVELTLWCVWLKLNSNTRTNGTHNYHSVLWGLNIGSVLRPNILSLSRVIQWILLSEMGEFELSLGLYNCSPVISFYDGHCGFMKCVCYMSCEVFTQLYHFKVAPKFAPQCFCCITSWWLAVENVIAQRLLFQSSGDFHLK